MAKLELGCCAVEIVCTAYGRMKAPPTDELHYIMRLSWQNQTVFHIAPHYSRISPLAEESKVEEWLDFELDDCYLSDTFFEAHFKQQETEMPLTYEGSFALSLTPNAYAESEQDFWLMKMEAGKLFYGNDCAFDAAFSWQVGCEQLYRFALALRAEEQAAIEKSGYRNADFVPQYQGETL